MNLKKIIALLVSASTIFSFAGCGKKADDNASKEVVQASDDNAKSKTTDTESVKDSIVGVWVVEKTEVYDGPMEDYMNQIMDTYYYQGAEWEFTEDNIVKYCKDENIASSFKIVSDNKLEFVSIVDGSVTQQEYELDGDSFVLYGMYTGDFAKYGRSGAIYHKRKTN